MTRGRGGGPAFSGRTGGRGLSSMRVHDQGGGRGGGGGRGRGRKPLNSYRKGLGNGNFMTGRDGAGGVSEETNMKVRRQPGKQAFMPP